MRFFLILASLTLPSLAFAADHELHGYLRAGTGNNGKGSKHECFDNQGVPGNPLRLGNECSIYGETTFLARVLKSEGETETPWFNTQLRLAFFPPGNSAYEDTDADSDRRDINVVEAYVEAGNIEGSPLTYWIGKRFYRDVDLHIFDWYYYAQMIGNGGGVDNITLGQGKLAVAYLMETGSTRTNVGLNGLQVADVRWHDVKIGENDFLNFWGAYGTAPGGTNSTTNLEYIPQTGWILGSRWRHNVPDGFNDFTVVYGTRLLESLTLSDSPTLQKTTASPAEANRVRVVEHLSFHPWKKWGLHFGAALEHYDPKKSNTDSRGFWWAVGARPVYFFTDHWQLAFEAGRTEIRVRDERTASGEHVGRRTLTRLTLAPQLSLGPTLWSRPVLRAYYTHSFWNEANKAYVGVNAPAFAKAADGHAVGVQTEVWF